MHEETSEISTKQNKKNNYKNGCFAQLSKHSIHADVNVGIEISKYVYPNVYSCESSFLYRASESDPVSSWKTKKHSKTVILVKLKRNMVKNCLRTKFKKLCVGVRIDITPFYLKSIVNTWNHLQPSHSFIVNVSI